MGKSTHNSYLRSHSERPFLSRIYRNLERKYLVELK